MWDTDTPKGLLESKAFSAPKHVCVINYYQRLHVA